ncbi:Triacylglycerol lipase protein [Dioscorea alata]|uniref:Triacylglycerol lipase protein n=1 Tax=Dioscorea alata TaxID=55571 RepID=A0ACB7TT38_DIOAL|nr:Triacylglycerol lipase protein [Dioscorea alata]
MFLPCPFPSSSYKTPQNKVRLCSSPSIDRALSIPISPASTSASPSDSIMLQRFVDHLLAVTKESVKTFTNESLNNIVRFINGVSALVLAVLPGKATILEGIHGWELRPTLRGPRLPRWMENGVSSFNKLIHELSVESDSSAIDSTSGDEDDADMFPASPSSQVSHLSRASSFARYDRRLIHLIWYMLSWILWPVIIIMRIPFIIRGRSVPDRGGAITTDVTQHPTRRTVSLKDHVVHRTTDRRRGVIEDLQVAIEIFIEAVFDIFHKATSLLLSPSEIWRVLFGWFSSHGSDGGDDHTYDLDVPVQTATLGDIDPTTSTRQATFHQSMNTDARTCQDVITELGYPYEAIRVVTSDGYVLLLERIPRRDSQKVVYLQHGILDSSMGWVSNGVVGSPAFAAFDQGYDVFLGNLRGLVSREHVDKNISSRKYWKYSINEHGTQDIPAMIEKIHQIKTAELNNSSEAESGEMQEQPYKLCVVCHSLGGAVMLMYVITRRLENKPHRLSRLILLSPAGFHEDSTFVFTLVEKVFLLVGPVLAPIVPGLYIPTRFFRMLLNKLARDFHNYPALGGLVQTLMSYIVGGDSSNWVGVLGLPHYNVYDMPGVSLYVALHLAQMKRARKFIMYDFGSAAANMEAYGSAEPLDLGQHYNLIDIPVDLVAGRKDKVIRPSMVRKHYRLMRRAGVEVSYNEFQYAHLDFTFSHREELLSYVMSRLLLVAYPQNNPVGQNSTVRLRKVNKVRINEEEISTEDYTGVSEGKDVDG